MAQIKVLYFASIADTLGLSGEAVPLPTDVTTVEGLKKLLSSRGDDWHILFNKSTTKCAVNQALATASSNIKDGDEVAFFPPVTGG